MYLGTTIVKKEQWGRPHWYCLFHYVPVVTAIVDVVKHVYRCDRCGYVWRFPTRAMESFNCVYSDECCQQLTMVSIDPGNAEDTEAALLATLDASAPDLLEACKWLLDTMARDSHVWCTLREHPGAGEWVRQLRAAIAKAEPSSNP